MLDRLLREGELKRAGQRARLVVLALILSLLVVVAPTGTADLRLTVYGLFVIQVVFAIGALGIELVKLAYTGAERRALQRHALALLAAHDERRRAVEERDELRRTVAGLRTLNEHLRGELRDRDDAVASAVHELRTPLTSVQAYGQLMSKNLHAVQRQVEQLDRLIGDLLGLPGAKPLATTEVDLAKEAAEAAHRVRIVSEADVDVSIRDEGPHVVRGDQGRLAQVFENLLRNAVKFSPPGAPIEMDVRREGGEVIVSITDRGAGIRADELPFIFERYFRGTGQRAQPGEGIGLAVSRQIVMAHQGRLWATSPGLKRGSTFSFALPVAVTETGPLEPTEVPSEA